MFYNFIKFSLLGEDVEKEFREEELKMINEEAEKLYSQVQSGRYKLKHKFENEENARVYNAIIPKTLEMLEEDDEMFSNDRDLFDEDGNLTFIDELTKEDIDNFLNNSGESLIYKKIYPKRYNGTTYDDIRRERAVKGWLLSQMTEEVRLENYNKMSEKAKKFVEEMEMTIYEIVDKEEEK